MVKLLKIIANDPAHKSTTYLADDGKTYTLKGDLSQRANNPGNISPVGTRSTYQEKFGAIGYLPSSPGQPDVAVFPDVASGRAAQLYLWQTPGYQNKTLADAAKAWATDSYAPTLTAAAGVPGDTRVGDLSPEQMQAVIAAQIGAEGSSGLTITDSKGTVVPAAQFFSTVRQPNSVGSPDDRQAPALPMPPLPRPRPEPPGGFTAPPPLIPPAPQGSPWDIPGVLNVGKEMALKPDAAGHYPTMASGYINRALANAVPSAPQIQQTVQDTVAPTVNAVNKAKDTALNLGSSLGNSLSGLGNMFGGMFGGSPALPTLPKPLPSYFGNDTGEGFPPPAKPNWRDADAPTPIPVPPPNNYGLPGYSGRDVAPPPSHELVPRVPTSDYRFAPPPPEVPAANWRPSVPTPPAPLPAWFGNDTGPGLPASDTYTWAKPAVPSNYGLPGYSGNDVAPSTLPLPAPPPLVPPIGPPTLPTAPLGHPGTPPGTPLHMTTVPFTPPPPPPVRLASGNTAQVGATGSAQGGRYQYQVRPDGSVVNLTTGRVTAPATR